MNSGNRLFRCIYVYEFPDNYAYIGLTYNLNNRDKSRKLQNDDAVTKHIRKTNLTPILKKLSEYVYVDVAINLEIDCIEMYKTLGWNVLNKHKGGALGASEQFWTKELCHAEALKYKSRSEFYYKNNKVYAAALRYKWLNDICAHMTNKIHKWNLDEVRCLAKDCDSRYEFQKKDKRAYIWAIRNNVLNDVCMHMQSKIGNNQYGKH